MPPGYVINMYEMKRISPQVIGVSLLAILLLILLFNKEPVPPFPPQPIKVIEKQIEGAEKEIHYYETKVGDEKKIIATLSKQIDEVRRQLGTVRSQRDTFQIVPIQDTLIHLLTDENGKLTGVVNMQDSIILTQRYIINAKDTIIALNQHQLKRVKRQRNISLVGNGVLLGALILKK